MTSIINYSLLLINYNRLKKNSIFYFCETTQQNYIKEHKL